MQPVNYAVPAGSFVHYTTMHRGCRVCGAVWQWTLVVDRKGLKQSSYVLWLN